MRRLDYDIVDVFTDRPFAGNQLAVVHGADDLSTRAVPGARPRSSASPRRRSRPRTSTAAASTPPGSSPPSRRSRSPGHPTLGTAWVLRVARAAHRGRRRCRCAAPAGSGCASTATVVELTATPRDLAGPLDRTTLARDLLRPLGLSPSDLAGEAWVAGCGLTFVHVPVSEEAVVRAVPSGRGVRRRSPTRIAAVGRVERPAGRAERVRRRRRRPDALACTRGCSSRAPVCPRTPRPGPPPPGSGWRWSRRGCCPRAAATRSARGWRWAGPPRCPAASRPTPGRPRRCHVAGRVQPVAVGEIAVPLTREPRAHAMTRRVGANARHADRRVGANAASRSGCVRADSTGVTACARADSTGSAERGDPADRAGAGPPVGGRGQVRDVQPARDERRRGRRPPLVPGRTTDAGPAQVSNRPPCPCCASRPRPGRRRRRRGAAARSPPETTQSASS